MKKLLIKLCITIVFLLGTPGFAEDHAVKERNMGNQRDDTVFLILTKSEKARESGCWATLYDSENFKGKNLTLVDGMDLRKLDFERINHWNGNIESIAVGPRAALYLFGGKNFEDLDQTLPSSSKVASVKQKPFWDDFESIQLTCID